jgi:hypothetical protein
MRSIEPLESRIAPASLTGHVLSYTDLDGDKVTISFSKGTLSAANFTFDNAFGGTGTQQLQRIDLSGVTDVEGSNISVNVVRDAAGDGVAHIGEIIAIGRDLGVVKTKGDVGKILAGNGALPAAAIKSLTIGSYGMLDGTTQPAGSNQSSPIIGDVPKLTILGDMSGGAINVIGNIAKLKIGGSIIGGPFASDGRFIAINVGKLTIGGGIIGSGPENLSGSLSLSGNVGTLKIAGSVIGGSPTADSVEAQVEVDGSVGKFVVGHDLHGVSGVGNQDSIKVRGTVGSFTVGGNITAPVGKEAGIYLAGDVNVPGTAVGSIAVAGSVQNATIGVGADLDSPVTLDLITIGGSLIKSRIVVGSSFGSDMITGTGDDVINAASRLNSIVIKGTVFGTIGGTDSYFIEAGRIGSTKLSGRSIAVGNAGNLAAVSFSGDVFLKDLV